MTAVTDLTDIGTEAVKGIGKIRASLLEKLGIRTVRELLYYFPRAYENYADAFKLRDAPDKTKVCVKARLLADAKVITVNSGMTIVKASATDGTDIMQLVFFNNKYVASDLREKREMLFYGVVTVNGNGGFEMLSPSYCDVSKGGYHHPVYRCTEGITSKTISVCVKNAIDEYLPHLRETVPNGILRKYKIPDIKTAIKLVHFPSNAAEITNARRRLIFEELLVLSVGLRLAKTSGQTPTELVAADDRTEEFLSLLPFKPTLSQKNAITDCSLDMKSGKSMRRLIQGDVGSGKTAVAAAAIFNAVRNGMQAVLMAPTEVLAQQHKKTFDAFFRSTGIKTELLTGSTAQKEKNRIKQAAANGDVDLIIGTHAVITPDVAFKRLGLCVTDEQHRFGVNQRTSLGEKGGNPHVLVMSATPIPRTLSLVIYGDLDISVIDEKPAGRKEIKTFRITSDKKKRMYGFIKKELDAGHQCFIVCPLAEEKDSEISRCIFEDEDDGSGLVIAEKYYRELSAGEFKSYKTALLHGKMKPKKKDEIMALFASGSIQLLVSTVVIEVGIDVPNATVIAIENAERFGLSQLHQLRGRCGRGVNDSFCILISDSTGEKAEKRFDIMCGTNDGFLIADEDLKMRGPGDFFGERQSGMPELKIADLMTDSRILYAAKNEADAIISSDPELSSEENKQIKKEVENLFSKIN